MWNGTWVQISLKIGIGKTMSQTNGSYMNVIFYSRHGKRSSLWTFTAAWLLVGNKQQGLNETAILNVIYLDKQREKEEMNCT